MKRQIFILLSLFSITATASEKRELAIKSLGSDLEKKIVQFTEDKYVFHYRYRGEGELQALKWIADGFRDSPYEGGLFSNAVYAASNPFISAGYGGVVGNQASSSWNLAVIQLEKNSNYLDVHNETRTWKTGNRISVSLKTRELLLQGYGCQINQEVIDIREKMYKVPECFLAIKDFVKAYKIKGVIYDWVSSKVYGCDRTSAAVAIYDSSTLNEETVKFYNSDSRMLDDIQNHLYTSSIQSRDYTYGGSMKTYFMYRAWFQIGVGFDDGDSFQKWLDAHLFCHQ